MCAALFCGFVLMLVAGTQWGLFCDEPMEECTCPFPSSAISLPPVLV